MPLLVKLSLVDNKIKKIENSNSLPALEELFLHGNQIEVFEKLQNFPSLKKLELTNQEISKIESTISLPALSELYLDKNKIKVL